jgi:hypothetical protein
MSTEKTPKQLHSQHEAPNHLQQALWHFTVGLPPLSEHLQFKQLKRAQLSCCMPTEKTPKQLHSQQKTQKRVWQALWQFTVGLPPLHDHLQFKQFKSVQLSSNFLSGIECAGVLGVSPAAGSLAACAF